ncbi:hypothetical protein [Pajaroellobacter abortibovis]|nr:hypothetical protein [Pajaroellobacter abortibovis]
MGLLNQAQLAFVKEVAQEQGEKMAYGVIALREVSNRPLVEL